MPKQKKLITLLLLVLLLGAAYMGFRVYRWVNYGQWSPSISHITINQDSTQLVLLNYGFFKLRKRGILLYLPGKQTPLWLGDVGDSESMMPLAAEASKDSDILTIKSQVMLKYFGEGERPAEELYLCGYDFSTGKAYVCAPNLKDWETINRTLSSLLKKHGGTTPIKGLQVIKSTKLTWSEWRAIRNVVPKHP